MATDSNNSESDAKKTMPTVRDVNRDLPAVVLENLNRKICVRIHIDLPQMMLRDEIVADNANAVVRKLKSRAAKAASFKERLTLMRTSDIVFAQRLVSRHNTIAMLEIPKPKTCEEFLRNWEAKGFATILPAD